MKKHLRDALRIAKRLKLDQSPSHIQCCIYDIECDGEFNAKSINAFNDE